MKPLPHSYRCRMGQHSLTKKSEEKQSDEHAQSRLCDNHKGCSDTQGDDATPDQSANGHPVGQFTQPNQGVGTYQRRLHVQETEIIEAQLNVGEDLSCEQEYEK